MWQSIRQFFGAPRFPGDDEQTRQAETLNALLLSQLSVLVVGGCLGWVFLFAEKTVSGLGILSGIAFTLWLKGQLNRGRVSSAGMLNGLFTFPIVTALVYVSGGVSSADTFLYFAVVVALGLSVGMRSALFAAGLGSAALLAMAMAEHAGYAFPRILPLPPFSRWFIFTISMIWVIVPLHITLKRLAEAIGEARRELRERQTIELALRESEERYRLISSVSSDYIFSTAVDTQGSVRQVWAAGAFEAITGYTLSEIEAIGGWRNIVHPDDAGTDEADMAAMRANRRVHSELRIIRKDNTVRWVRVHAQPVWDERENRLRGIYGGVEDITDQRRAEDELHSLNTELERRVAERTSQLEAANREVENFSYTIAHDLRSPARAMIGFSRLLGDEHASQLDEGGRKYLAHIRDGAERMGRMIDGFLEFTRLGRAALHLQQVSVNRLVARALEELKPSHAGRDIQFRLANLPDCTADPDMLQQVWAQLLANAVKFTRPRATAVIEAGSLHTDHGLAYFVRDNGIGFDMQYAGKLFGLFQRLHQSDDYKDAGIGLATVQRIIQRHGGRIWAEAQVDGGAAFYFTVG
jgi:PAS domain S-box-containing protein